MVRPGFSPTVDREEDAVPVKQRAAKDRRPFFSAQAVELFAELERTPGGHMPYTDASYRLAEMLGLVNEWWSSCHVNDRSRRPCWSPGHLAYTAFWKVREVREALLAICAQRGEATQPEATGGTIMPPKSPAEPPTAA